MPWYVGEVFSANASTLNALPRVALVIGNSKYPGAPLPNPANDASAIAGSLGQLGFTVISKLDAGREAMDNALTSYGEQLAKSKGVGLFYFAGHGLQVSWRNFLVPVDAALSRAEDVPQQTLDITRLFERLSKAGNPMNIVILDACRDNPFGGDHRSGKGLSQMDAPLGTLLAYATAPGNVASDGSGANGLYTENLLREIHTPEARIEDVFKRVRLAVRRSSNGRQIPWESTSLEDDFYFLPPANIKKLSQEVLDRQYAEEIEIWRKAQTASAVKPVEDYLKRYPSGRFSELAQVHLDRLLAKQGERKVSVLNTAANPYTKGTGVIDLNYRIGDRYVYRTIDLLTKIEERKYTLKVTEVTEDRVIFNNGALIYDRLGNMLERQGATYSPSQFHVAEYSIGKKWSTRYTATYDGGKQDAIEFDLKVVARENISVPAGTFDCFVIEASGWALGQGLSMQWKYWIAPAQLNRVIAIDSWWNRSGRIVRSSRDELESYTRAG